MDKLNEINEKLDTPVEEEDFNTIKILERQQTDPDPSASSSEIVKHNAVQREINIAKVQSLMQKGVTDIERISKATKLTRHTTSVYMEAVKARWALEGSKRNLQESKGAGLSRLAAIERELWNVVEGRQSIVREENGKIRRVVEQVTVHPDVKIRGLTKLLDCHDKRLYLEGASAGMLQELPTTFNDNSDAKSVSELKLQARRYEEIAKKLSIFFKDKAIDITPKEK